MKKSKEIKIDKNIKVMEEYSRKIVSAHIEKWALQLDKAIMSGHTGPIDWDEDFGLGYNTTYTDEKSEDKTPDILGEIMGMKAISDPHIPPGEVIIMNPSTMATFGRTFGGLIDDRKPISFYGRDLRDWPLPPAPRPLPAGLPTFYIFWITISLIVIALIARMV